MPRNFDDYRLGACLFEDAPLAAPELAQHGAASLPERIDLRALCSPIEDQGTIGSCAANAAVGALEYHQRRSNLPDTDLSRLFVYYNARRLAGNEAQDSGTFIHHAMAAILAYGACPEAMWPYQKAMWATRPIDPCYTAASGFAAIMYARAAPGDACKAALVASLPIVFGAVLPAEMLQREAAATGRIEVPRGAWPEPGGGHAMLIVGYDDARGCWLIRNSWGADWGDGGYAQVPYEVMERYGIPGQFWVLGAVDQSAGLRVAGASMTASQQAVRSAAAHQTQGALARLRDELRDRLEGNLANARADFRQRLRGPGAGGGY